MVLLSLCFPGWGESPPGPGLCCYCYCRRQLPPILPTSQTLKPERSFPALEERRDAKVLSKELPQGFMSCVGPLLSHLLLENHYVNSCTLFFSSDPVFFFQLTKCGRFKLVISFHFLFSLLPITCNSFRPLSASLDAVQKMSEPLPRCMLT